MDSVPVQMSVSFVCHTKKTGLRQVHFKLILDVVISKDFLSSSDLSFSHPLHIRLLCPFLSVEVVKPLVPLRWSADLLEPKTRCKKMKGRETW